MPLLRAAGVRAKPLVTVFVGGTFVCLNALVAGGGSAGSDREQLLLRHGLRALSQCPCCGRGECGETQKFVTSAEPVVSMPLLRAGGVRDGNGNGLPNCTFDWSQCPCCGRGGVRVP